jgi:hypothetical protein
MTKKAKTLKDIAVAFHGVTSVNIFTKEKNLPVGSKAPDAVSCRVIYQSDIARQEPWRDPDGIRIEKVARRFIEEERRGLGQKPTLAAGDILVTTRGRPYVSPLVTPRMLAGSSMVAGPDLIVVRAKQARDAALVRRIMLSRKASAFFSEQSPKVAKNQGRVLPKSVIMDLPLEDERFDLKYSFDEGLEAHASESEAAAERMALLSRAFVELARWRSELVLDANNQRFDYDKTESFTWEKRALEKEHDIATRRGAAHQAILDAIPIQDIGKNNDWSWKKPFDEEYERLWASKDQWASAGIVKCLDDIANGRLDSADSRLLCGLLSGGSDTVGARAAMISNAQLVANTTLLLHQGHHSASTMNVRRSVRQLLASCVSGMEKVMVLSAEAGHQAVEVVTDSAPPVQVALVESRAPYRDVAAALCRFVAPTVDVSVSANVSAAFIGEKIDAAILEASGFDAEIKDNELERASRQLFDWANLNWRLKEGGKLIVHIPTSHWKLLSDIRANVTTVVQLPPMIVPAYQAFSSERDSKAGGYSRERHALCDQGMILVIEPGWGAARDVRFIDATMLTGGDAVTELTTQQLEILKAVILHKELTFSGLRCFNLPRDVLFRDQKSWPGVAKFIAARATCQELIEDFTLETLIEEMQFRHRAWKVSQEALLSHVGVRLKA